MTLLQSVFLGIVQGITEFLPISSSGHLAILQNIFHIDTGGTILFDILLHLGTLIVVFIVFWNDIWKMICVFFSMLGDIAANALIRYRNRKAITKAPYRKVICNNYRKFVVLVLISTIPTGIMGYVGKKLITDAASTLIIPGICLIITGILLLISDRAENCTKIPQDTTYREGVIIGIAQGFATLPGLSRSGTTIATCLLCGLDRTFAVKYSFILSIPAILGAAVLELGDISTTGIGISTVFIYLAGMAAAAITGFVCIRALLVLVRKKKFRYFAFYCFAAGLLAVAGQFIFL